MADLDTGQGIEDATELVDALGRNRDPEVRDSRGNEHGPRIVGTVDDCLEIVHEPRPRDLPVGGRDALVGHSDVRRVQFHHHGVCVQRIAADELNHA